MKVTFITHSCYHVELENCCLLFDYFKGAVPQSDKPLYVFASHSHEDHFSPWVFNLAPEGRQVHYFLSHDIFARRVPESQRDRATFVRPRGFYEMDGLRIATLRSTDAGVAFLLECEGKLFYHAGDLNCWVWDGAPRLQNDQMTEQYKDELSVLGCRKIDVAFVPLDPRQETDFDLGMKYFFQAAEAQYVFPMHMWGDYSVIPLFKSTPGCEAYAPHILDVKEEGQVFDL